MTIKSGTGIDQGGIEQFPEKGQASREQSIREAAYRLYERRLANRTDGDPDRDWIEAEAEVDQELQQSDYGFRVARSVRSPSPAPGLCEAMVGRSS